MAKGKMARLLSRRLAENLRAVYGTSDGAVQGVFGGPSGGREAAGIVAGTTARIASGNAAGTAAGLTHGAGSRAGWPAASARVVALPAAETQKGSAAAAIHVRPRPPRRAGASGAGWPTSGALALAPAIAPDLDFALAPAVSPEESLRALVRSELDREVKPLLTEILSVLRALEGRSTVDRRPGASELPPSMIIARARAAAAGGDHHRAAAAALWPEGPGAWTPRGEERSSEPAHGQVPWVVRRHHL